MPTSGAVVPRNLDYDIDTTYTSTEIGHSIIFVTIPSAQLSQGIQVPAKPVISEPMRTALLEYFRAVTRLDCAINSFWLAVPRALPVTRSARNDIDLLPLPIYDGVDL
ncbi:hypothetical protein N0V85_002178 [Neurospora sp. IMI 360204]|nr:hypothetical protein N0V85_002178 [Neurospora sp. IMI 360204]